MFELRTLGPTQTCFFEDVHYEKTDFVPDILNNFCTIHDSLRANKAGVFESVPCVGKFCTRKIIKNVIHFYPKLASAQ